MTHTTKHTPGPWVVNADGRMIEAQLPNLRNEYEHICDLRGGIKGQINLGNAYLIAAAPAMYEALQIMVKAANVDEIDPLVMFASIERAKGVLAQAEGHQHG